MAKIPLTDGFSPFPEGTYVFRIDAVDYNEPFGKLKITMSTKSGKKYTERFSLQDTNGGPNDGALAAFSFFAKTALNDFTATEIDPKELVGYFIEGEVVHTVAPSTKKDGETVTFVNLGNKYVADGFEEGGKPVQGAAQTQASDEIDLDALLGL